MKSVGQVGRLEILRSYYYYFSVAHENFSILDHILGHKANLHKYKQNLK
jgi:hypothetical protein